MSNQRKDILLLLARLAIGGVFIYHGWGKVSGIEGTVGFFGQMGLPAIIAYIVAYAELLGGLAIILGFLMEWAAIGLGIIMLGAIYYVWPMGFQVIELPLSLLAGLLALWGAGGGRYAVSRKKYGDSQ